MGPRNKACRKRPKLGELKAPDWPGLPGPCALQGASAHRCKACEDPTGADKGREKLRRSFVEGRASGHVRSGVLSQEGSHGHRVHPLGTRRVTRRVEPTERRTVKCPSLLLSLLLLRAPFSHQVWPTAGRHLAKSRIAMGSARLQVFWKGHGRLHRAKPTPSPLRRSGQGLAPLSPSGKDPGVSFMHRPYRPPPPPNQTAAPASLAFSNMTASISRACTNLVPKLLICRVRSVCACGGLGADADASFCS